MRIGFEDRKIDQSHDHEIIPRWLSRVSALRKSCRATQPPTCSENKKVIKGFLNLPYFAWTVIALIIAGIFIFIWPHKAVTVTTGFRYFVIRYGHSLTWILLAISFFLHGLSPSLNGVANVIALAGGLKYLLFMAMTFVVK